MSSAPFFLFLNSQDQNDPATYRGYRGGAAPVVCICWISLCKYLCRRTLELVIWKTTETSLTQVGAYCSHLTVWSRSLKPSHEFMTDSIACLFLQKPPSELSYFFFGRVQFPNSHFNSYCTTIIFTYSCCMFLHAQIYIIPKN